MIQAVSDNEKWQAELHDYLRGWHTWNNQSVLSYIQPLENSGLRLYVKNYKHADFLQDVMIGEEQVRVIPKAHAYDDSYTELHISWEENEFTVRTACDGQDLYVSVTTEDERLKPALGRVRPVRLGHLFRRADAVSRQ